MFLCITQGFSCWRKSKSSDWTIFWLGSTISQHPTRPHHESGPDIDFSLLSVPRLKYWMWMRIQSQVKAFSHSVLEVVELQLLAIYTLFHQFSITLHTLLRWSVDEDTEHQRIEKNGKTNYFTLALTAITKMIANSRNILKLDNRCAHKSCSVPLFSIPFQQFNSFGDILVQSECL